MIVNPLSNLEPSRHTVLAGLSEVNTSPDTGIGIVAGELRELMIGCGDTGKRVGGDLEGVLVRSEIVLKDRSNGSSEGAVTTDVIRERWSGSEQREPGGYGQQGSVGVVHDGRDRSPMVIKELGSPGGDGGIEDGEGCERKKSSGSGDVQLSFDGDLSYCVEILTGRSCLSGSLCGPEDCLEGFLCASPSWSSTVVLSLDSDLVVLDGVQIGISEGRTGWSELSTADECEGCDGSP